MTDASRAVIFGRDAATYDAIRPSYPPEAIGHVRGLVDAETLLEVGAGTGKATVDMARPDLDITCLEPSPKMAKILADRTLPGVHVVVSTFEDWDGRAGSYDLIYAAQAWHWVDHDVAYEKALDLLRPDGAIALMWNVPHDRYEAFSGVYEQHAPELLAERDLRVRKRDSTTWGDDLEAAGFEDVDRFTHHWSDRLTARQTRDLYSTYSDHMLLPEEQRNRLLDAVEAVGMEMGDSFDVEYRTEVFSGRKT